jgi:hypothetical protein
MWVEQIATCGVIMESEPIDVTHEFYSSSNYSTITDQRFFYLGNTVYIGIELNGVLEITSNTVEELRVKIVISNSFFCFCVNYFSQFVFVNIGDT